MPAHAFAPPPPDGPLLATQAARQLGVSIKALRLYEQWGLLQPARTASGYRRYDPPTLRMARNVVALRSAGLSLAQIARLARHTEDDDADLASQVLVQRQEALQGQFQQLQIAGERLRALRQDLAEARWRVDIAALPGSTRASSSTTLSFNLPWPWAGELFSLTTNNSLVYLVGPLGSGKTRLALQLAEVLPEAVFLPQNRLETPPTQCASGHMSSAERERVDQHLAALRQAGATDDAALRLLWCAIEREGGRHPLVIDMIEQGLTQASQEALMPLLRARAGQRPAPIFAMTRSSSILDLPRVGAGEAILLCPANHACPFFVTPVPGAFGHETLTTCLSTPVARARLEAPPTS